MNRAYDSRKAELAKIHIAKKQLQLDDDTYRAMLWTTARVHSSKELDAAGRRAVLDHLRARGFASRPRRARGKFPGQPHNIQASPQLQKVEALLAHAGRPWSYVDAMAQRMFSVERVAWCTAEQLHKVIAALAIDQRRRAKGAS